MHLSVHLFLSWWGYSLYHHPGTTDSLPDVYVCVNPQVRKASEVEKENMAALQQLQERNQEALEGARRNLEEERKNSQALQKRAAELQTVSRVSIRSSAMMFPWNRM